MRTTTAHVIWRQTETRVGGERPWRQRSGDDGCGGRRWRQRMTTAKADNISGGRQWHAIFGRQTAKGMDKIWRQERAETQSSNDGCGSGSWQQWTLMAADDDDGNNRR